MSELTTTGPSGDDAVVLVLSTYRSHVEITRFPTLRVVKANCGHLAWLSPQGEPYVETSYTCCLDCAPPLLDDPTVDKRAVDGAADALGALHGQGAADAARAFMRKVGIRES